MVEIPEHLRKRAEEARAKAEAARGGGDGGRACADAGGADSGIPSELLERSKAARGPGRRRRRPRPRRPRRVAAARPWPPHRPRPRPPVPGGHTQRLLTVVKAGSIQDVKATPVDKVHTWPHLLLIEFVAALGVTAFLLFFSIFVNAPLLELANPNQTPNPSKAPWYFLGLQELLTMFHPMVAGVTIPTHRPARLHDGALHRQEPEHTSPRTGSSPSPSSRSSSCSGPSWSSSARSSEAPARTSSSPGTKGSSSTCRSRP